MRVSIGTRLEKGTEMGQSHMDVGTGVRERVEQEGADIGKLARLDEGHMLAVGRQETAFADLRSDQKDPRPPIFRGQPLPNLCCSFFPGFRVLR